MPGLALIFLAPSACLVAMVGIVEGVTKIVRRRDDRDRKKLVSRYRNVRKVTVPAQPPRDQYPYWELESQDALAILRDLEEADVQARLVETFGEGFMLEMATLRNFSREEWDW